MTIRAIKIFSLAAWLACGLVLGCVKPATPPAEPKATAETKPVPAPEAKPAAPAAEPAMVAKADDTPAKKPTAAPAKAGKKVRLGSSSPELYAGIPGALRLLPAIAEILGPRSRRFEERRS
jgi:hypothetical protein